MAQGPRQSYNGYWFRPLSLRDAFIVASWRYPPPYLIYNIPLVDILLTLLIVRFDIFHSVTYYTVLDEQQQVVGLFTFTRHGSSIELGLGLRPDQTGHGKGLAFVQAGMDFARERFRPTRFTLDVATFNQRARKVYERAGFIPGRTIYRMTQNGRESFLEMYRSASLP